MRKIISYYIEMADTKNMYQCANSGEFYDWEYSDQWIAEHGENVETIKKYVENRIENFDSFQWKEEVNFYFPSVMSNDYIFLCIGEKPVEFYTFADVEDNEITGF